MSGKYEAIIIGSGPNGFAAAIYLQQRGLKTAIFEQDQISGGACKTLELTLPGFRHDLGSAIHPLAFDSSFFKTLPLEQFGLRWIHPAIPFAHPFDNDDAIACYKSIDQTAEQFPQDRENYKNLFSSLINDWNYISENVLGPFRFPDHPLQMAKFGWKAIQSARGFSQRNFKDEKSRLLFYGAAAHSTLPLTNMATASFGLVLNILAHKVGWPFPAGGAGNLIKALEDFYRSLGGEVVNNFNVTKIDELPTSGVYIFDVTPRQLLKIEGTQFSSGYRRRMSAYRYGPGIFKADYALSEPIPFKNEKCRNAGTVHIGYSTGEIENSGNYVNRGKIPSKPYILLSQHTIFDSSRAPSGKHTAWVYCHVPHNSQVDMFEAIEMQIEKAAPGFRDIILEKVSHTAVQMEKRNPNLVGGDINGGKQDLTQLFTRPVARISPYSTPDPRVYICSSSTPPGGGVHGMGGFHAARQVWKDHFR
jgi:phytoene dehydrogenase-like protein